MTKEVVDRVIELLRAQKPFNVIAKECGISKQQVRNVALGRKWKIVEKAKERRIGNAG